VRAWITAPSRVLFLALFASQAGVIVLTPILVQVAQAFDVTTAVAGQLRMIGGFVAGCAALVFGRYWRRIALRDLLLVGAVLLAMGCVLSAAAPTFLVLAVAQVPIGIAVALLISAGTTAAGEWAPARGRSVLARTLVGPPVAWIIGMPIIGLVAVVDWRLAFLVLPLVASLIVAGALALCRPGTLPKARPIVRFTELAQDPALRAWMIAEVLAQSAWVGTLVFCGALFVETYGTSSELTGVLLAIVAAAYIPGNVLASRMLRTRQPLQLLPWLAAGAAVLVVATDTARSSIVVTTVLLASLSLVVGGRTLVAGAFALGTDPGRRLAVMGVRTAANQFGYFIGAALGGLALAWGGYTALGIVYGTMFLVAALVLASFQRSQHGAAGDDAQRVPAG
jgi:DHA1 family inner membrane transport protein